MSVTTVRSRPLTVEELRDRLAELVTLNRGRCPVLVQTIVGGDLVTDDVPVEAIRLAGHGDTYALLVPDAGDPYRTRELIDEALDHRAAADEDLHAAEGVLRDLRRRLADQ